MNIPGDTYQSAVMRRGDAVKHPDEYGTYLNEVAYLRQLQAYKDWSKASAEEMFCVRSELLAKLI